MENIEEKLFDYLEGRLSAREKAEVEALFRKDTSLRKQVERIKEADGLMTGQRLLELEDADFTSRVMEKVDVKSARLRRSNRLMWMALGIFAAIFAAASAFVVSFSGEAPASEPTSQYLPLPELPSFDLGSLLESLNNPALVQLVIIINAIAVLLVADRLLGKKMKHTFKMLV